MTTTLESIPALLQELADELHYEAHYQYEGSLRGPMLDKLAARARAAADALEAQERYDEANGFNATISQTNTP